MSNTIAYRGYIGSVEFSEEDGIFFGKVLGISALLSYEGSTADALLEDFHGVVDGYLATCELQGTVPEKPYKGSFNVRINTELHRAAAITAMHEGVSLNAFVERAIRQALPNPAH